MPANDKRLSKPFFSSSNGFTISSSSSSQQQKCTKYTIKYLTKKLSINEMQSAHHCLCFPYFVFSIQPVKWFRHKTGWHKRTRTFNEFDKVKILSLLAHSRVSTIHTHTEMKNHAPCTNNSKCSSAYTFRIANCRIYFGRTDRVSAHCTHIHNRKKLSYFMLGVNWNWSGWMEFIEFAVHIEGTTTTTPPSSPTN